MNTESPLIGSQKTRSILEEDIIRDSRTARAPGKRKGGLGDFTTTLRVIPISLLAMLIGFLCAFVALALLRLIGLFTNLFYFGRWSMEMVSPAGNHLGYWSILVPIGGALIIGVIARMRMRVSRCGLWSIGWRRAELRACP